MGVSQRPDGNPLPAAVISTMPPEVSVDRGQDGEVDRVLLSGTMYHDGLNRNAWGLSEIGAKRVADRLVGDDHVAAHPMIRGGVYDRSMSDGPGFPIGSVIETDVITVDEAMLDGGEYTAQYTSEITDPIYASRYANGVFAGDQYSVSIGIYGDPEAASCSVCGHAMASDDCSHERFEEVEVDTADGETETQIAGPLYDDGKSDHLASVYMPAYEGSSVSVTTASAGMSTDAAEEASGGLAAASNDSAGHVPHAASVLAEPFDSSPDPEPETASDEPADDADSTGYPVEIGTSVRLGDSRDSFEVTLDNE